MKIEPAIQSANPLLDSYGLSPRLLNTTRYSHDDISEVIEVHLNLSVDSYRDTQFYRAAVIPIDLVRAFGEPVYMEPHDMEDVEADNLYIDGIAKAYRVQDDIPPVVVSLNTDGTYEWIDGQHRMTAAQRAGVTTINAMVRLESDEQETQLESKLGVAQQ